MPPFDAVVSSTALHWLQPGTLVDVYRRLTDLLRPGGIVLNGDHLSYSGHHQVVAARIARADDEAMQQETFAGDVDTWDEWWQAVAETPRYAAALARRSQVWGPELHQAPPESHGSDSTSKPSAVPASRNRNRLAVPRRLRALWSKRLHMTYRANESG